MLAATEQSVRQNNYVQRAPEVAAAQVLALLHQGNLAEAAALAQSHELPLSQARVHLAQGDPAASIGGAWAIPPAGGSQSAGRMNACGR